MKRYIILFYLVLVSLSSFSQGVYTQTGNDSTWAYIIEKGLIPISEQSTTGITGSTIDVNNYHPLIYDGLYKNYPIYSDIRIHTLGNSSIERSDFSKWSRWYQEDGNTQVFRLFQGEHNVRNDRRPAPRIEAETNIYTNGTKGEWHEWSGRYTILKAGKFCLFQIWGYSEYKPNGSGLMMIEMREDGSVYYNPRDGGSTQTFLYNAVGQSFDLKVRDNGLDYEVYINGVLKYEHTLERTGGCHFRWGLYGGQNVPEDIMMFVTGAQVDAKPLEPVIGPVVSLDDFQSLLCIEQPIGISANASDEDGDIISVEMLIDGVSQMVKTAKPYTFTIDTPQMPGEHLLQIVATDNDNNVTSISEDFTLRYCQPVPISKATKVEAEYFFDASGVNVKSSSQAQGCVYVESLAKGDWIEYEVEVDKAGDYTFDFNLSSKFTILFDILVDGEEVEHMIAFDTGGNEAWVAESRTLYLAKGHHSIRLVSQSLWNFDYMMITPTAGLFVSEQDCFDFDIVPNPAESYFSIKSEPRRELSLSVLGLDGKIMYDNWPIVTGQKVIIDKKYKAGIYMVVLMDSDKISRSILIVK